MKLNTKLLFYIVTVTVIVFISVVHIINLRFEQYALDSAKNTADEIVARYAGDIESKLNADMGVFRALSKSFSHNNVQLPPDTRDTLNLIYLKNILEADSNYIAVFLQWELDAIEHIGNFRKGRRRESFFRNEMGEINFRRDFLDTAYVDTGTVYHKIKSLKQEYVVDPYYYSYRKQQALPQSVKILADDILETTIIVPILDNNRFLGMTGADIPLERFRRIIDSIQPFEQSFAFLISNNGKWLFHPDSTNINQSIDSIFNSEYQGYKIYENINEGLEFSFIGTNGHEHNEWYYSFHPVQIGSNTNPWSFGISVPIDVILIQAHEHLKWTLTILIIGIILIVVVIYLISNSITYPLKNVLKLLNKVADGDIQNRKPIKKVTNDEIGELTWATNTLLDKLKIAVNFAYEIGRGNYNVEYELLGPHDTLGKSLIEMRDNLRASTIELQKLSLVASRTVNAITIMNPEGIIGYVNDAMLGLYRKNREDLLNKNLVDVSYNPDIKDIIHQCNATKKSVLYEISTLIDGRRYWLQTTLSPVLDDKGEIIHLISIDADFSRIKQAELKISQQKDEILKQRDELSELLATKDKFFSIIAHDMKNPWASLLSITQSLSDQVSEFDEEEMKFYLHKVFKSADLIHNMLQNLLYWASAQTGRLEFKNEHIDIYELIEEIFQLYQINAEKKSIILNSYVPENLSICGDKLMLSTIIQNLVNNAIKFTPPKGHISVYAEEIQNYWLISVKDTGMGISDDDIKKLFRIDVKTKSIGPADKEMGTGLGLILCREFVEYHNGKIWVESTVGNGSVFKFTLSKNCPD